MNLEDVFCSIDRIEEKVDETLEMLNDLSVTVSILEEMQMPVGKLLEAKEVAKHLDLNVRTIYEEIKNKRLPATQITKHGKYFIKTDDLRRYVKNMREESDQEREARVRARFKNRSHN